MNNRVDSVPKEVAKEEATALLFEAAETGNAAMARAALDAGADINSKGAGRVTPLHCAVNLGDLGTVKVLIENGADINAKDVGQVTPLDRAYQWGHYEIAELLEAAAIMASSRAEIIQLLDNAAKQQGHAGRVTGERKDKGPPQVGG